MPASERTALMFGRLGQLFERARAVHQAVGSLL
jgi:hypothetical protein